VLWLPESATEEVAHFSVSCVFHPPVCPDEASLGRFAGAQGDPAERAAVESHLDKCEECRAVVAVLVQTAPAAASAKGHDPDVEHLGALSRLTDTYEVESVLGAGGMGVVLGARHRLLGHAVAVKVLRPSLRLHAGAEQRFLVEARAGARLSSPHIARVLDAGRLDDGLPFLVLDRLDGEDGERFLSHGLPRLEDTLDVAAQVVSALHEAHRQGLVHRDLKPANLFIRRSPTGRLQVKVLDFGLAKVLGDDLGLTSSQGFIGSPLYVAPEQLRRASDVDARADVWGVGCLLYRFLTGRVPFPASSVAEVVTRIQRDEPTPLQTLRPEVPDDVAALVHHLLQKSPLERPGSVGEVALRLRPRLSVAAAVELDEALGLTLGRSTAPLVVERRARPARWLVAGTALVSLIAGFGLREVVRGPEPSPSLAPAAAPIATGQPTEPPVGPAATAQPAAGAAVAVPAPAEVMGARREAVAPGRTVTRPRAGLGAAADGGGASDVFEVRE
jgi:hypothetical protein